MKTRLMCALTAFTCLIAGVGGADTVRNLSGLGEHPFTGTHAEACELHVGAHGYFNQAECLEAIVRSDDASQCPARAVLQDGTVWWMLFTYEGEHRIGRYRIAFGDDVPVDDPLRMSNDCTGVAGAESFIWPHACGNYAVPQRVVVAQPAPRPAPAPRVAPPALPQSPQITSIPSTSSLQSSGGTVAIHNVYIQPYCLPGS